MLEHKAKHYEILAGQIIGKLNRRRMEGYYAATKEAGLALIRERFLRDGVSVCWGGSMTLEEIGLLDFLKSGESGCVVYDRMTAKTPEEEKAMKANMINADYFLMSTNAITMDGELLNIDGRGNRLSYLLYGPENVLVVAGMNKVCSSISDAYHRVKDIASPANTLRLGKDTPCARSGRCGDCYGEESICSQTVVTRRSQQKGRIKVILIGEELGY